MGVSTYQFKRWEPKGKSTWAWRVYKKHNTEFQRMYSSFDTGKKYTYQSLGKNGAQKSDDINNHLKFEHKWESKNFSKLDDWILAFNDLENWVNLNSLVAILSNLETYMATIIPLALESDIGVLYGVSHRIDGVEILKHGKDRPLNFDAIVLSCTKGTWDSRVLAYERAFGIVPKYLKNHVSELDLMRNLRNNVAHAFGREIESSRLNGKITTIPISRLSRQRLLKFQAIVWKITKSIDRHLYNMHIGEYQALVFYHNLYPDLNHNVHQSMRAMELRKEIGRFGIESQGKEFCKGLVAYYEGI